MNYLQKAIQEYPDKLDIDDYIDEWHLGTSELKLHAYLGIDYEDYKKWAIKPSYLNVLIKKKAGEVNE
jgi:hypothetical protein